jgi:hypothetical protein
MNNARQKFFLGDTRKDLNLFKYIKSVPTQPRHAASSNGIKAVTAVLQTAAEIFFIFAFLLLAVTQPACEWTLQSLFET